MLKTHKCFSLQWHIREVEKEWAVLEGKSLCITHVNVYDDITNYNILENRVVIRVESQAQ